MKKVCEYCGRDFETTIKTQKYCNMNCKEKEKRRKKHLESEHPYGEILKCEVCGKGFTRKSTFQKYCSNECSNLVRAKRRRKHDAPINPKRSDDATQAMLPEWAILLSVAAKSIGGYRRIRIKCNICGHEMERTTQIFKPSKIGGIRCERCHSEAIKKRAMEKTEQKKLERIEKEKAKCARITVIKPPKPQTEKICIQCGVRFMSNNNRVKCCSTECMRKNRNKSSDCRISKADIKDYSITLSKLIKRDHNVCHICGGECDALDIEVRRNGVMVAGNNYPSIDHVIPLAKGGNHTWDNVKLAHRICNTIKKDKIM